jgi:hypothetical protein
MKAMLIHRCSFLLVVAYALIACSCADASKDQGNAAREAAKPRTMEQRFNSKEKIGYFKDSEGNWKANSNKRSSFESKGESSLAKRQYNGKQYNAGEVQKKSWWGDRNYDKKVYQGNTDANRFLTKSAYSEQSANEGTQTARDAGRRYQTESIARKSASEESGTHMQHSSDAETDNRRRVFAEPSVIDWKAQRSMDVQQTRSLLGH